MDSIRDAIITLKNTSGKFQTMLVDMNQSQEIKRFRHLKALVAFKFNSDAGVPQHKSFRPDIVRRADAALSRISKQSDYGYEQAVSRIKNAWRNESCLKLAESILR